MEEHGAERFGGAVGVVRAALVVFVLAWLLGPDELRIAVPVWLAFLIALGLELHFFAGWPRTAPRRSGDRSPQAVDRDRYGYAEPPDDLLLVERGGEQLWIPYAGETGDELEELIRAALEEEDEEPGHEPEPERPRPLRQLLAGLAVIAALAALVWLAGRDDGWKGLDQDRRAEATERFSAEAGLIVGRPVSIRCDESGDFVGAVQHADGVAAVGGRLAYLTPRICFDLYRLAFEDEVVFSRTARAIAVLAHEAWHLRGVRNEGVTECYGLQSGVGLGVRLGLSEGTARRMMRQQLVENAGRRDAEYRVPPECRDGGELDSDPASTSFP